MRLLSPARKRRLIKSIVKGERIYKNRFSCFSFLIITEDGGYKEVNFNNKDFAHLTGLRTNLSDIDLFESCLTNRINESNIDDNQYYRLSTLAQKSKNLEKIDRIIYANPQTNLVLLNLHTHTASFPMAIESKTDRMVVAFSGYDLHARSLRNNNQVHCDEKKNIIGIFSKFKNSRDRYSKCVYLKNAKLIAEKCNHFMELVSVDIIDRLLNTEG